MRAGVLGVGYDLYGAGGYHRWTNFGWGDILTLGEIYGWQPMGTGPPPHTLKADWFPGSYFGYEGQLFYAKDAKNLADALAEAAERMPVKRPRKIRPVDIREYEAIASPEGRALLREFVEFCRAGSFRIY